MYNSNVHFNYTLENLEETLMPGKRRGQDTKERILEEACRVFAGKGYRNATHAEICRRAGTNVASINYYFGTKENLYLEVFEHLNRRINRLYPLDGGLTDAAPAEKRLHAYILGHLRRMFDPENLGGLHQIRMSEMFDPTGLLEKLLKRQLAQDREQIQRVLAELLGPRVSRKDVEWCELSIIGQCFVAAPGHGDEGPRKLFGLDAASIEQLAEHILTFSTAGIDAVRRRKEERIPASPGARKSKGIRKNAHDHS